ncbi:MAG: hypothetical protein HZB43_08635 [candidate division Zixibacteria bacterium]|nr:hypothetical protein [candidate division Zixibacteria bacterium]
MPLPLLLLLALLHGGAVIAAEKPDSSRFPSRVNIRLMRTLERQLSEIERALVDDAKFSKERVRNVTMPLQNFIDDVVLASGRYTDIYPQAIYDVLVEEFATAKPRVEIADLLVEYQRHGQFKARAEAKDSKVPQKGRAGV